VSGSRCLAGIFLVSFRQPPRVVFYTEKSNISYTIYQAENDPRELILHEQYVDAAAAEAHRQSEHYKRIVVNEIIPHLEVRAVISVKKLL